MASNGEILIYLRAISYETPKNNIYLAARNRRLLFDEEVWGIIVVIERAEKECLSRIQQSGSYENEAESVALHDIGSRARTAPAACWRRPAKLEGDERGGGSEVVATGPQLIKDNIAQQHYRWKTTTIVAQ